MARKKMTEGEEKKILQTLTDRQATVKEIKKREREEANKYWNQFWGRGDDPRDMRLRTPKTYIAVWVALAKFINLYVNREIFNILPRGTEDRLKAKIVAASLNYEVSRIPDYQMVQILQMLQFCIEGWTIMKVGWDEDKKRLLYPYIKNEDIFFDPTALVMSEVEWVHQRVIKSRAQLQKLGEQGIYQNIDKFLSEASEYRKKNVSPYEETNPYKDKYEIFECWTRDERITAASTQKGVGEEGEIIFDTILTPPDKRESPFKEGHGLLPYAITCFDPITGLQGAGIPQILRSLQKELDATRRLHLKASELGVLGLWAYKAGTLDEIGKDVLRNIRPGAFPLTDFLNLPQRINTPVSPSMFTEERLLNEDIEDASASYRPLRGAPMERAETLGGMQILHSAGNERQEVRMLIFSCALQLIGKLMLKTLFQYQDKEIEVKVFDGDKELWQKVKFNKKEELKKEYNLILTVAPSEAVSLVRQNSLVKVLQLISGMPDFAKRIDRELLVKMLISAIDPKLEHQIFLTPQDEFMETLKAIPPEELRTVIAAGLQALQAQKSQSPAPMPEKPAIPGIETPGQELR